MSWWVYLESAGDPVTVEKHEEGGTRALGGTTDAELNITYNYGGSFRRAWPETLPDRDCLTAMLDGRKAADTLPSLARAVEKLGTDRDEDDYWKPTDGNAGYALSILLRWATANPEAMWRVS